MAVTLFICFFIQGSQSVSREASGEQRARHPRMGAFSLSFDFWPWEVYCSCGMLDLRSREFKPALSLTVVISSFFVFVFSQLYLLPRRILPQLIGHGPPCLRQTHTRRWPGFSPPTLHAESVHLPATNQHSARCRASQSKRTHVAPANFCP